MARLVRKREPAIEEEPPATGGASAATGRAATRGAGGSSSAGANVVRVTWDEMCDIIAEHEQGQHVAVVGPTGSGKSVLLTYVAKQLGTETADDGHPARVTIFGTKPRDRTLTTLERTSDFKRIKKWPPDYGVYHAIVWPPYGDPATAVARQKRVFEPLLRRIFVEGGQTVIIDEAADFEDKPPEGMGLQSLIVQYWRKARALDLTLAAATQRPRHVTRYMWSEPDWLFIFRLEDVDDLKRLAEIGGNTRQLKELVPELEDFEFLLVRRVGGTARRKLYISRVEL